MSEILLAEKLGEYLTKKNIRIAVAESCTGGLLGHLITNVPGASKYFIGGIVAYDNSVKMNLLGVRRETLETYGAVSEQCAIEMAIGVKKLLNSDVSIGITGIAGPTGGSSVKPIGLVYMAVASEKVYSRKYNFSGDRVSIKLQAVENAMRFLMEVI